MTRGVDRSGGGVDAAGEVPSVAPTPSHDLEYTDLRLREHVGTGGNAVVHRVTIPSGESVALKRPHVAEGRPREQFLEEAETWSYLRHGHVVSVHGWGVDPEPWIAMEFADAGALQAQLGTHGVAESIWLAIGITRAVRYAHERGVMHYDLKPENVLLFATDGDHWAVPKVTDWGLSELLLTLEGGPAGLTYAYAAPEQFQRGVETGPQTDIYQLGATVYAVLVGRPPIDPAGGDVVESVVAGDWTQPEAANPTLPRGTDRVLTRALATDPANRYEHVVDFERALERLFWDAYDRSTTTHQHVNARRTGVAPAIDMDRTASVVWQSELEGAPLGPPLVRSNELYLATRSGGLHVLETGSGSPTVRVEIGASLLSPPEIVGDELYCVTDGPALLRVGLDPVERRSEHHLPFVPRRYGLHRDGHSYLVTAGRELVAIHRDHGVQWSRALEGNPGGLVAGTEDAVVVATAAGTSCLDARDGTHRWSVTEALPHRATPAISSEAVVVPRADGVAEHALSSGERRWETQTNGAVVGLAMTSERVFVGTDAGVLYAVIRDDGTIQWERQFTGREMTSPLVAGDTVFVGAASRGSRQLHPRTDGVFAFATADGTRRWALAPGADVVGPPVALDDGVVVTTGEQTILGLK